MTLECLIHESKEPANSAIVFLHGLGADGHDFSDVTAQFNLPSTRFIFPHAPHRPITLNQGYEMRAWYDIYGLALNTPEDHAGVTQSGQAILSLIDQHCADIPYDNIIIGGFSQGAAMALHLGVVSPKKFAGVIALSGYMPIRHQLPVPQVQANKTTPVFLAHGTMDMVVPFNFGEVTREYLLQHEYELHWKTYPIGHTVSPVEMLDIQRWVSGVLAPAMV